MQLYTLDRVCVILFKKKRKRFRPVSSDVSPDVKYTEREARVQDWSGVNDVR